MRKFIFASVLAGAAFAGSVQTASAQAASLADFQTRIANAQAQCTTTLTAAQCTALLDQIASDAAIAGFDAATLTAVLNSIQTTTRTLVTTGVLTQAQANVVVASVETKKPTPTGQDGSDT